MDTQLLSQLEKYVATSVLKQPGKHIAPDAALISSGLIDSFSLVDLALYVEDTLGVHLDDTELNAEHFDTLERLAALIESRRAT
jgi:acyl carrier protein